MCTSSTMPMMALSTGVSLQPSAMRALLPETAMTRSRKPARRGGAGIGSGANRRHIAANHGGDVARPDLLPAHQVDLGGLHHRVGGLDHGNQTARFDHS